MGFKDCWDRVKQITRLKKQSQLADFLGVSSSNTSDAKLKDRFPLLWAYKIGQEFNISTDWIMTGKALPTGKSGEEESDETLSEENQVQVELDYILQHGNTYQRGALKGYISEMAAEIAEKIKKEKSKDEKDKE